MNLANVVQGEGAAIRRFTEAPVQVWSGPFIAGTRERLFNITLATGGDFTVEVNFEFATATRVLFGAGKLKEVGALAQGLGKRALVVIGKSAGLRAEMATATHAGAVQRVEPMLSALTESGHRVCDVFGGGRADS